MPIRFLNILENCSVSAYPTDTLMVPMGLSVRAKSWHARFMRVSISSVCGETPISFTNRFRI